VMTMFILFSLKVLGALKHWDDMSFLQYLSPSHYDTGLWLVSWPDMLLSIGAYIAFGAFFIFLADRKLAGRDL
jgi:hypothetical protein